MPGLSPIKILGNVKFMSANLKLPAQKASGGAKAKRVRTKLTAFCPWGSRAITR